MLRTSVIRSYEVSGKHCSLSSKHIGARTLGCYVKVEYQGGEKFICLSLTASILNSVWMTVSGDPTSKAEGSGTAGLSGLDTVVLMRGKAFCRRGDTRLELSTPIVAIARWVAALVGDM